MGHRKSQEEDSPQGAPEWMVTFSDCMTLLLTFFVLLLSFSSFDNKVFKKLQVIYSTALDSITPIRYSKRDSLEYLAPIRYKSETNKGSEKPTMNEEKKEGLLKEQQSGDLNDGMVLLLPSENMFYGNGTAISLYGRGVLDDIALYLAEMPNRIVISERSTINDKDSEYLHLQRAWAVMDYLVSRTGIDKNRFSISISGTLTSKETKNINPESNKDIREMEISLLQRSVYN
ncbi:MAG: hypothetical protein JW787_08885 [Sedimentisphaerales bacterium]|nr:hypothetical protein [Sedimentisphaerales bacterium]